MLKNLVTLVTGGASGLGLATVERFVKRGAEVIVCDLSTSDGNYVAKSMGSNVKFLPADITSPNEIENLVNNIEQQYGKLNILVNCAGIANSFIIHNFNKHRPCELEHFRNIVKTNTFGTYNVIRAAIKLIEKNEPDENGYRGVIVNTAGIEGTRGHSGQAAIAAASNGIIHMTKPLAAELREQGIRVVTISPGLFKTALTDFYPPDVEQALEKECFNGPHRFGEPDEFAHMVQTIVLAPHINGTNIELAAGLNVILY